MSVKSQASNLLETIEKFLLASSRTIIVVAFFIAALFALINAIIYGPDAGSQAPPQDTLKINELSLEFEEDGISKNRRLVQEQKARDDFLAKKEASLELARNETENHRKDIRSLKGQKRGLPAELANKVKGSEAYEKLADEIDQIEKSISARCGEAVSNIEAETSKLVTEASEIASKYGVKEEVFGPSRTIEKTGYADEVEAGLRMDRACPEPVVAELVQIVENYMTAFPDNYGFTGQGSADRDKIQDYIDVNYYRKWLAEYAELQRKKDLILSAGIDYSSEFDQNIHWKIDDVWAQLAVRSGDVARHYSAIISKYEKDETPPTNEEYAAISVEIAATLPAILEQIEKDYNKQIAANNKKAADFIAVKQNAKDVLVSVRYALLLLIGLIAFLSYLRIERNVRKAE